MNTTTQNSQRRPIVMVIQWPNSRVLPELVWFDWIDMIDFRLFRTIRGKKQYIGYFVAPNEIPDDFDERFDSVLPDRLHISSKLHLECSPQKLGDIVFVNEDRLILQYCAELENQLSPFKFDFIVTEQSKFKLLNIF